MPKRFTDTQIWEKEWFMKLKPIHKCLWRYLTERCDQSGVWEPNWQLASIYIGEKVSQLDLQALGDQIEIMGNGKVFIPDFVNFQYGQLSDKSPAHKPVFAAIKKNNLSNRVFNRVSNTLQEKEKEKEEDKEMEKEDSIDSSTIMKEIFSDAKFMTDLQLIHPGKDLQDAWNQCFLHHSQRPRAPTEVWEWRQKLNGWLINYKNDKKPNTAGKFNP